MNNYYSKYTCFQRGGTLVELLMTVFILTIGIGGVLVLFVRSMSSASQAWDMTVATTHAEYILEDMVARPSLDEIMGVNWTEWLQGEDVELLSKETIEVKYSNIDQPLSDIAVKVQWAYKDGIRDTTLFTSLYK